MADKNDDQQCWIIMVDIGDYEEPVAVAMTAEAAVAHTAALMTKDLEDPLTPARSFRILLPRPVVGP